MKTTSVRMKFPSLSSQFLINIQCSAHRTTTRKSECGGQNVRRHLQPLFVHEMFNKISLYLHRTRCFLCLLAFQRFCRECNQPAVLWPDVRAMAGQQHWHSEVVTCSCCSSRLQLCSSGILFKRPTGPIIDRNQVLWVVLCYTMASKQKRKQGLLLVESGSCRYCSFLSVVDEGGDRRRRRGRGVAVFFMCTPLPVAWLRTGWAWRLRDSSRRQNLWV